jgi:phosphoglycerate dehydrogenase-like enzyme
LISRPRRAPLIRVINCESSGWLSSLIRPTRAMAVPNLRIAVEFDHYLRILAVILDPDAPDEHRRAVADFFAHDMPDLPDRYQAFRTTIPGLYPAQIRFAASQAELQALLPESDVVVVESFQLADPEVAAMKPGAIVHKFGALTSNIDVQACAKRRIPVLNLPRKVNAAVAEHAFSLMAALVREIPVYNGAVTAEFWEKRYRPLRPFDQRYTGASNFARIPNLRTLAGSTLGIVGLGEVGREIARRAAACGMSILYYQRGRVAAPDELDLGVRYSPLSDLMAESDFVIVQLPLNDTTRGIIGRKELEALKPGAMLINAARAALVDRDALLSALESGKLGGLAMDVGYQEPWPKDDPLLRYLGGNVIFMPHTAIGHREIGFSDLEDLCRQIWRVLDSRRTGRRN